TRVKHIAIGFWALASLPEKECRFMVRRHHSSRLEQFAASFHRLPATCAGKKLLGNLNHGGLHEAALPNQAGEAIDEGDLLHPQVFLDETMDWLLQFPQLG